MFKYAKDTDNIDKIFKCENKCFIFQIMSNFKVSMQDLVENVKKLI